MRTPPNRIRPSGIALAALVVAALAAPALGAEPTASAREDHVACPEAAEPRCASELAPATPARCDCSCEVPEASDTRRLRLPPVSF